MEVGILDEQTLGGGSGVRAVYLRVAHATTATAIILARSVSEGPGPSLTLRASVMGLSASKSVTGTPDLLNRGESEYKVLQQTRSCWRLGRLSLELLSGLDARRQFSIPPMREAREPFVWPAELLQIVRSMPTHGEDSGVTGCGDAAMKPIVTTGRVSLMLLSLVVLASNAVMGADETFRLQRPAPLVARLGRAPMDPAGRRRGWRRPGRPGGGRAWGRAI